MGDIRPQADVRKVEAPHPIHRHGRVLYANHMPRPPRNVEIAKVAVDSAGQLSVQPLLPGDTDFAHIYRAAMGVRWDAASRQLIAPAPREWSQADWFKQVARAVRDEYGVRLYLSPATQWMNVSPENRAEIESWSATLSSCESE
jgi:hypothetical protein